MKQSGRVPVVRHRRCVSDRKEDGERRRREGTASVSLFGFLLQIFSRSQSPIFFFFLFCNK